MGLGTDPTFPGASPFELYLRTGRGWPVPDAGDIEVKFNPWHDLEDGRFTFAGAGRYFARGGAAGSLGGGAGDVTRSRTDNSASWTGGSFTGGGGGSFGGGGATGRGTWPDPAIAPSTNGSGATARVAAAAKVGGTGTEQAGARPLLKTSPAVQQAVGLRAVERAPVKVARPGSQPARQIERPEQRIVKNGYEYRRDAEHRTTLAAGTLTLGPEQGRSRSGEAGSAPDG